MVVTKLSDDKFRYITFFKTKEAKMRCLTRTLLFTVFIFVAISFLISASASEAPRLLKFQGTLLDDDGKSVNDTKEMSFKIYETVEGGTALWNSGTSYVSVLDGKFTVTLNGESSNPFPNDLFSKKVLYIATTVEGNELKNRMRLASVPYALNCGIPIGVIVMWSGSADQIPEGWALCDGNNGTPDLRDRFVVGAGNEYTAGNTGGIKENDLSHKHEIAAESSKTSEAGNHSHRIQHQFGVDNNIGTPTTKVQDNLYDATTVSSPSHMHSLNFDSQETGTHSHTVNSHNHGGVTKSGLSGMENRPPYYALCFIMKL